MLAASLAIVSPAPQAGARQVSPTALALPSYCGDARGRYYTVTMVSDETAIALRRDWRRIPRFAVIVETSTEEI